MTPNHHPMQKAWRYYRDERLAHFDRAVFARCLRAAHEMARFERDRDAGKFMPRNRVEVIDLEIASLPYRPFSVDIGERERALRTEKAGLEAVATLPAIQNREAA